MFVCWPIRRAPHQDDSPLPPVTIRHGPLPTDYPPRPRHEPSRAAPRRLPSAQQSASHLSDSPSHPVSPRIAPTSHAFATRVQPTALFIPSRPGPAPCRLPPPPPTQPPRSSRHASSRPPRPHLADYPRPPLAPRDVSPPSDDSTRRTSARRFPIRLPGSPQPSTPRRAAPQPITTTRNERPPP